MGGSSRQPLSSIPGFSTNSGRVSRRSRETLADADVRTAAVTRYIAAIPMIEGFKNRWRVRTAIKCRRTGVRWNFNGSFSPEPVDIDASNNSARAEIFPSVQSETLFGFLSGAPGLTVILKVLTRHTAFETDAIGEIEAVAKRSYRVARRRQFLRRQKRRSIRLRRR